MKWTCQCICEQYLSIWIIKKKISYGMDGIILKIPFRWGRIQIYDVRWCDARRQVDKQTEWGRWISIYSMAKWKNILLIKLTKTQHDIWVALWYGWFSLYSVYHCCRCCFSEWTKICLNSIDLTQLVQRNDCDWRLMTLNNNEFSLNDMTASAYEWYKLIAL